MTAPPGLAVEHDKLVLYLLNPNHEQGASKAKWFLNRGFSVADPKAFADALAEHAVLHWPGKTVVTPDADKRVMSGPLATPDGNHYDVLTVWQIKADGFAWFVTARPERRR